MKEIYAKRILFLTRVFLVTFSLGVLSFIHKRDSKVKGREYFAITKIAAVVDEMREQELDEKQFALAMEKWVVQHRPDDWNRHAETRQHLIAQLDAYCGAGSVSGVKTGPSRADFTLSEALVDTLVPAQAFRKGDGRVSEYFDRLHLMLQPVRIRLLWSFDTLEMAGALGGKRPRYEQEQPSPTPAAFEERIDENGNIVIEEVPNAPLPSFREMASFYRLHRVCVNGERCKVYLEGGDPTMQMVAGQFREVEFPVTLSDIPGPTPASLFTHQEKELAALAADTALLKKVEELYGELPMEKTIDIVSDDFLRSYQSIEVFGFTFTTTSFPIALLFFNLLAAAGLAYLMYKAWKERHNVLTRVNDEDIVDLLLDKRWLRTLLWLGMPVASLLLASLNSWSFTGLKNQVLTGGTLLLAVICVICLVLSFRVDRIAEKKQ